MDDVLEGLEPETQALLLDVLAGLTGSTLLYIGRSDVFSDRFSPKVFHLAPLLAVDTKNEASDNG